MFVIRHRMRYNLKSGASTLRATAEATYRATYVDTTVQPLAGSIKIAVQWKCLSSKGLRLKVIFCCEPAAHRFADNWPR